MWRDPDAVQTKPATKIDPSASARSPIRRQPTVRHSPRSTPQRSHGVSPGIDRRDLLELIRRDRENAELAASYLPARDEVQESLADYERREASNRRRLESGRALLRDALSYEQPGQRIRQIRESALRNEVPLPVPSMPDTRDPSRPESRGELIGVVPTVDRWSPPPRYMPTPPYAPTDATEQSPVDSAPVYDHLPPLTRQPGRVSSLTPRFAPSYGREESPDVVAGVSDRSIQHTHIREGYEHGLPPLRRNRHRVAQDSPNNIASRRMIDHADGLGDRRRSFSPEENTWETLLTTITPDDRLPTPSSSFVSATASASSLSSNSGRSAATFLTLPSSRSETINTASNVCDDPTDSESSDTDDGFTVAGIPPPHDDPPSPNPNRYSANIRAAARASQEINEHFARLRRRTDQEIEYQRMQALMDRMDRQEPIPDEWWATAGLSRSVSGRVDRTERERL
ncbi:hypothetical protein MMC13_001705 [Lambiella insularis]|nr:hypothetical protein [Lambiella insularis]